MPTFSVTWRQPGVPIRMIIIILVYAGTYHFAPHEMTLVIIGTLIGGLVTAEPGRSLPALKTLGRVRYEP
jgi:hypothetical protein